MYTPAYEEAVKEEKSLFGLTVLIRNGSVVREQSHHANPFH